MFIILIAVGLEVCIDHRIDAEAFVEEWVAFAETNLSGKLQPSLQTVDMMVRKQFVKQEKINNKQEDSDIKVYNPSISTYPFLIVKNVCVK